MSIRVLAALALALYATNVPADFTSAMILAFFLLAWKAQNILTQIREKMRGESD